MREALHMPIDDDTPLDMVHFDLEEIPPHLIDIPSSSSNASGELQLADDGGYLDVTDQKEAIETQPIAYERRRVKFADLPQIAASITLPRWARATIQDAQNQPMLGRTRSST